MASASANVVLTGMVKKTEIARDGTAVVVKKKIDDAKLEERFPKRQMKGKRKANDQAIPVQDVARAMEGYAETIKPEVARRVEGMANKLLDKEIKFQHNKSKAFLRFASQMVEQEKRKTQFHKGNAAASRAHTPPESRKSVTQAPCRQRSEQFPRTVRAHPRP
jgi:hypothetical protein